MTLRGAKKPNRIWSNIVKIAVSLALLTLVLRQVGWRDVWASLSQANRTYLGAAFVLYLLGMVVRAYRWQVLLSAVGVRASLSRLTHLYFVGAFFNQFLPTGFGGDVVRSYELIRQSERPAESIGTVLVDRATGLLALFVMALVALAFGYNQVEPSIVWLTIALAVGGWVGAMLFLQRGLLERLGILRLVRRFKQLGATYDAVQACGARAMLGAMLVSGAFNLLLIAVNYLIAIALGVHLPLALFFLFTPIISTLLMFPLSLSGLGVREGAYVVLFGQVGVTAPLALTMSLAFYLLNVAMGGIGGILYVLEGAVGLAARKEAHVARTDPDAARRRKNSER